MEIWLISHFPVLVPSQLLLVCISLTGYILTEFYMGLSQQSLQLNNTSVFALVLPISAPRTNLDGLSNSSEKGFYFYNLNVFW